VAQDIGKLLRNASVLWWDNLWRDFDKFLNAMLGSYGRMVDRLFRLDIPAPGGTAGLFVLGVDAVGEMVDAGGVFLTSISLGPFLAILEAWVINFQLPPELGQKVVTLDDAIRTMTLIFADRARDIAVNPNSVYLTLAEFGLTVSGFNKELAAWFKRDLDSVLVVRLKALVKRTIFLFLQALVVFCNLGLIVGMTLIINSVQNDAINLKSGLLQTLALRQTKQRRRRRRNAGRYTREEVSQVAAGKT